MTKVWHWLVLGAAAFYSWPVLLHFSDGIPGELLALASMVWLVLLVAAAAGAWSTLTVGWAERVKIRQWRDHGGYR